MDDALIEEAGSPERGSLLPGAGFFVPDSIEEREADAAAATALADAEVAVVADPDADGLVCVALLEAVHGDVALIPTGPHDLARGLERVAEYAPEESLVYVCDLCPDAFEAIAEPLEAVVARADTIRWFDHHQWDDPVADAVRAAGVELVIGESNEECSADVAKRSLAVAFDEQFTELVAVARDHDLWLREDPRSDDLADYAYWTEPEEFISTVSEYGAELPERAETVLAEQRVTKRDRIDRAVRRADYRELAGYTVGITYGRCSQNEVAEQLREAGADVSVIVKPSGSASLRGTESFARCHEVAARVNGGGHPKAAGCKPAVYDDMLDYAYHWTTQGAQAKQAILSAFAAVTAADE